MPQLTSLLGLASVASLVAGHGYVDNATISGVEYQFYQVSRNHCPRRIRTKLTCSPSRSKIRTRTRL